MDVLDEKLADDIVGYVIEINGIVDEVRME
jgi:hypothetical protein